MSHLTIRNATSTDEPSVVNLWQACGLVTSYNVPIYVILASTTSARDVRVSSMDPRGRAVVCRGAIC
jgi:hypothetical protein